MKHILTLTSLALILGSFASAIAEAADLPAYTRRGDVVYGRKYGNALTMDVLTPMEDHNGVGVIFVVSSSLASSQGHIAPSLPFQYELLRRGYTVFAVVHSSQPKFTVPEILKDLHKAVRFIRYHGKQHFDIDPDHIGITGASSGGYLALMQGVAGNAKNPNPPTKDPVELVSSRVQAVACFCPCTDWLNYGASGKSVTDPGSPLVPWLNAAFDFHEYDNEKRTYVRITDEKRIREIMSEVSPITHITPDDPPTLIIHGSKDTAVPTEQSVSFIAKMKAASVPAQLVIKEGESHNWKNRVDDMTIIADWFDKYLRGTSSGRVSSTAPDK